MGSETKDTTKKRLNQLGNATSQFGQEYSEGIIADPALSATTMGAIPFFEGAKASVGPKGADILPREKGIEVPGLPQRPGGQGSASERANRARLIERKKRDNRKGRQSTILTGAGGVEEEASLSRKSLLGA